jgi:hypothetical protein
VNNVRALRRSGRRPCLPAVERPRRGTSAGRCVYRTTHMGVIIRVPARDDGNGRGQALVARATLVALLGGVIALGG